MRVHSTTRYCAYCGQPFIVSGFRTFFKINPGLYCKPACYSAHKAVLPVTPLADRFWKHVQKTGGCWTWTASLNEHGYGRIATGPKSRGGRIVLAHRASWELHYGTIPEGMGVLHRCDTPACVRPDHLFLGDQSTNMRDCSQKGRTNQGERCPAAKLTAEQVREIRHRYAQGGVSQQRLADEYGLAQATVHELIVRETWKHIE